jgi:hypothetical protein
LFIFDDKRFLRLQEEASKRQGPSGHHLGGSRRSTYLNSLTPGVRPKIQRVNARDKFNANVGLLTAPKKRVPEVARKYDAKFNR